MLNAYTYVHSFKMAESRGWLAGSFCLMLSYLCGVWGRHASPIPGPMPGIQPLNRWTTQEALQIIIKQRSRRVQTLVLVGSSQQPLDNQDEK